MDDIDEMYDLYEREIIEDTDYMEDLEFVEENKEEEMHIEPVDEDEEDDDERKE